MKTLTMIGIVSLAMLAPLAGAQDDCVPTSADPATINQVDANGSTYYVEERNNGLPAAVPGSGFVLGDGTWLYQESNTLSGLQRGGVGLTGDFFPPGCDQAWDPTTSAPGTYPCALQDLDPINDETCGNGPDTIIF